jgi:hypothetical protein
MMFVKVLNTSLMITAFVALMMVVVDYANVLTRGLWQNRLFESRWTQYILGAMLGVTPGCLGAFAVVAIYTHGMISLGALVAAMIATTGDEAFVMLALFPEQALLLMAVLFAVGVIAGWITDRLTGRQQIPQREACRQFAVHDTMDCECFPAGRILSQWRDLSLARGVLTVSLLLFVISIAIGSLGPPEWDWKRLTLIFSGALGLFIVATVPEHFLQDHLWKHVALKHVHPVFLWTFGAILATELVTRHLDIESIIESNVILITVSAGLLGLIPESGPHLLIVSLYAAGTVPLTVLLTNSIVQDGHGMLPLLAHSRRVFIVVKAINFAVGLLVGIGIHYVFLR